jgi:hypothetical protein
MTNSADVLAVLTASGVLAMLVLVMAAVQLAAFLLTLRRRDHDHGRQARENCETHIIRSAGQTSNASLT